METENENPNRIITEEEYNTIYKIEKEVREMEKQINEIVTNFMIKYDWKVTFGSRGTFPIKLYDVYDFSLLDLKSND